MKRVWAVLLAGSVCAAPLRAATDLANAVVVIVNDAVITYKDVLRQVGPSLEVLMAQYGSQPAQLEQKIKEARRDAIEQLVERRLILDEFKKAGYNLPDSIIEERVKERIRERYGDRLNLTRTLNEQGMTLQSFRERIREDFIISAMRAKNIAQELIVSPHKIEKYYADNLDKFKVGDRVKLRTITIDEKGKGNPGAGRRIAEEIVRKLDQGTPFAEMAGVYSEDSFRPQGGARGWVEKKELREELAQVAFSLPVGQRSEIIELGQTYFILSVEERQANHTRSLSEVRDEIEKTLIAEEQARLQKQWIERLKDQAFVRYF
ncbi:MAG: hypothetical protein FJ387_30715 [Verrucomicrobia bacterium]|nr:hypothetical protein [Verrucomicrobiota bacterium]